MQGIIVRHAKDKEIYFLQQGWARLVEVTETEGQRKIKTIFTEHLDLL